MLVFLAHTCGHVSAYGLLGGRAHALLSMWVHAYFYCAIYNKLWALISFSDICVPACYGICDYTLTILLPHTLPYYPRTQHPPCPLSQATTIGDRPPPSIMGARRRPLRLAHGSADSVPLRAHRCLQHAPPKPHTRPRTSQHHCTQPHSTPTSSPPTFLHPIAISILAVNSLSRARCWASSQKLLRIERHPTSTQLTPLTPQTPNPHTPWQSIHKSLGCNPLLLSPKSVRLLGVHRHRTGWRLVGAPFRSTLQTV